MLNQLPDWWVKATNEPVWMIRVQQKEYLQQVQGVVHGGDEDKSSHVTIFHEILNDPNLPNSEKTDKRMIAEAESLVGAGTLTSAHMLALTSYFVLANPGVRDKLVEELEMVMPDPDSQPSQQIFEGLPYLNAVMDEGFRLSYGSMHRLSRSHAKDALQYGDYVIPPGTPVGYSPYLIHTNPSIFPDPHSFKPERWLGIPSDERQKLRSYLSNFGRGSRQCVGMRLAYSEIYLTMGYLFRRLGKRISLKDTDYERDVRFEMDYFIPAPKVGSRGVRVAHA
jgi:cytochrome P450